MNYEVTGRLEDLFLEDELFIDELGYRCSVDGPIHRVCYYREFPNTPPEYHIHHIDCIKLHNRLSNLIAIPAPVHFKIHKEIKRTGRIITRSEIKYYVDQYFELIKTAEEIYKKLGKSALARKAVAKYKSALMSSTGFSQSKKYKKKSKEFRKGLKETKKKRRKYNESLRLVL